jgi:NAD(P)-dependent dehydrogenase (short-subunit alcohol dehydrogenase family)
MRFKYFCATTMQDRARSDHQTTQSNPHLCKLKHGDDMKKPRLDSSAAVVKRQRAVQSAQDARDKKSAKPQMSKRSVQAGTTREPAPPMPAQHLKKPGLERDLKPAPKFKAKDYRGSDKLKNKIALITGGDSGIGRAVAVLFAREGADIAIVYLSETVDAKETQRHVIEEGRRCLLIKGDVRDPRFCTAAVTQVVDAFGTLDVLVNNAAFQEHAESLNDLTEEHFDLTMKTNIYGYFHMAKAALPHLSEGCCIINTGSETGLFGNKDLLDYSSTKGAIHAFTRALATNLLPQGIRVNAVAPGPVWTPLNPADKSAKDIRGFGKQSGMKRPAQPEEISPAYVYLASQVCSSYVTGVILPVMGGVTPSG